MPKKIFSNGNRTPIRYENWNGTIAVRYDGNVVLKCVDLSINTIKMLEIHYKYFYNKKVQMQLNFITTIKKNEVGSYFVEFTYAYP